jgi:two-component system cell cycle response regulator DivK
MAPAHEHQRVLLVEDTDDLRIMISMLLRRKNVEVLEARNGQEAIDMARAENPDLILMDLSMPVVDGFQATTALKNEESTKSIPIIALSAHCYEPTQHVRALQVGCIECLGKPVEWEKLWMILKKLENR